MKQKQIFKLKKLFKDDELVKSGSLKLKEEKQNRTINSISKNGISFEGGGHAEGGKISTGNKMSLSQFIVVQAKIARAGYDYNSKSKTSQADNGGKAASHLDYINQQNRNTEEQVVDQTFNTDNEIVSLNLNTSIIVERDFTTVEGKEYSYSFKDNDDYYANDKITDEGQALYLKALKSGKIEADLKIEIKGGISENREQLEALKKDFKLFLENDRKGNISLHIQGKKEDITQNIGKINKLFNETKTKEDVKDIYSNVMNKFGNKMAYEEFNSLKVKLKKGVEANLKFEISPKYNYDKEKLTELTVETMKEFNRLSGKNLDYSFAIHTNTAHHHIHIDINGSKKDVVLSKDQLQAFKTLAAETLYKIEVNDEAKQFMMQEQQRLLESKQVQEFQNSYDGRVKINNENKFENIVSIGRSLNQEIKISSEEAKVMELYNRLSGIKSSLENTLKHAETSFTKEDSQKKIEELNIKINRLEKNITPELVSKIELFGEKFEDIKNTNLYNSIKNIYRAEQLEAVKEFSNNLKAMGKTSLANKVLKAGNGQHFNQEFDKFGADRVIRNLHANEFIEKDGVKLDKSIKEEFKELSNIKNREGKHIPKQEVQEKLNEITSERSSLSINKEQNAVELKIVQAKFIDTVLVNENGFNKGKLETWGENKIRNADDYEKENTKIIVDKYKEAVVDRVENLETAGILKENGSFVDGKAKEILFENAGKNIKEIVSENKNAYSEAIEIKEKIENRMETYSTSKFEKLKEKEALEIVKDNKNQLSKQASEALSL